MCIHLKIYIINFDSFYVLLWERFNFFECFYSCLPCLTWFFPKTWNFHFYNQIKQKTGSKFHSCIKWEITKPRGNFSNQINLKDSPVFRKSILGQFTILVIHFKIHFQIIHFIRNQPQFLQELLLSLPLFFLRVPTL